MNNCLRCGGAGLRGITHVCTSTSTTESETGRDVTADWLWAVVIGSWHFGPLTHAEATALILEHGGTLRPLWRPDEEDVLLDGRTAVEVARASLAAAAHAPASVPLAIENIRAPAPVVDRAALPTACTGAQCEEAYRKHGKLCPHDAARLGLT